MVCEKKSTKTQEEGNAHFTILNCVIFNIETNKINIIYTSVFFIALQMRSLSKQLIEFSPKGYENYIL